MFHLLISVKLNNHDKWLDCEYLAKCQLFARYSKISNKTVRFDNRPSVDDCQMKFIPKNFRQVTGQERQRVRPAAQMLSERVGKCLLHLFGQRFVKQAQFVITCDEMFDTCNFRCFLDGKAHRSAFGLEHTINAQYTSLLEFMRLIRDSRVGCQSRYHSRTGSSCP